MRPILYTDHRPMIRQWLLLVMGLIVLMVWVGGITRLTESGLSIVEWKLFSGTLPPLSDAAWQAEFAEYQTSPEFQQINTHFSLVDFQKIYWLEYLHRLLGRVIGLSIVLPFFVFAARRELSPRMVKQGLLIAVLVCAQGAVGWIMVASGLVDQPRVAPVKLALHLSLAFILFLVLLNNYWKLRGLHRTPAPRPVRNLARVLFLALLVQIILGALVAGLDAGLTYNTYPLMDGKWVPGGLMTHTPHWINHVENITMVQFQHRMGALLVVGLSALYITYAWKRVTNRRPLLWLGLAIVLQFMLGVATLLSVVNIALASAHQLAALLLLSIGLLNIQTYAQKLD